MESIKISYSIRIEGTQFREISFSDTTPEFKNIILKPSDEKKYTYEILINKNIFSTSSQHLIPVFNEAHAEVEKFKYIFSVAADIKIFDFECLGYYFNDKLICYNRIFKDGLRISGHSANLIITKGEQDVKDIKEKMQIEYDLPSIQMFFDSATIIEPVGRFLSLYTLLLHKYNDSQKLVDEAILKADSTVAQFKSPHARGHETIFSKLRNEMSHKRDGTNILETQNKIRLNVERFEKIIKELVISIP